MHTALPAAAAHRAAVLGLAVLALVRGVPAGAAIGTADVVPAATLLLPYFEVDVVTEPPAGGTVVTIINTAAVPTVARLVLWTDYGIPTHGENLLLSPFEVANVSLGVILDDGGAAVIAAHRGQASALFGGLCAGFDHGDGLARGYVTIDNVSEQTDLFPGDPGYFDFDVTGVANNDNQLTGQYLVVDAAGETAEGGPLVHVEANDDLTAVSFYSRETGFNSTDNRERLASAWGTRYWNGLTDLVCWRDDVRLEPFSCPNQSAAPISAQGSTGVPLELIVFDHAAAAELPDAPVEPCLLAAGRVRVGGPLFRVGAKTGWIYGNVDPDAADDAVPSGFIVPPPQAFFGSRHVLHPDGLVAGLKGVELSGFRPIVNGSVQARGAR